MGWINAYRSNSTVQKWVAFFVGCLQMMALSPFLAIGACALDMKTIYGMNQEQYGLASMLYVVGALTFVATGPMADRFGSTVTSTFAFVLTVPSHLGLWLITTNPFEHQHFLIYALFLLGGIGMSAIYSSTMSTNLANFNHASHGLVAGTLMGLCLVSSSCLSILYREILSPKLDKYFLVLGIALAITNLLAIFFMGKIPEEKSYEEIEPMRPKEGLDDGKLWDSTFPFWLTIDFQLLIWSYAILLAVTHIILVTFSIYAQSLNFETYITPLVSATPFITGALLFTIGFLSDVTLAVCSRMSIALVMCVLLTFVVLICIQFMDNVVVLVLLTIANSGPIVTVNIFIPPEFHKLYGENRFGTSMGIASVLSGSVMLFLQYVGSWLYDKQLKIEENTNVCLGKECFFYAFILHSTLMVIAICCNVMYLYRQRNKV